MNLLCMDLEVTRPSAGKVCTTLRRANQLLFIWHCRGCRIGSSHCIHRRSFRLSLMRLVVLARNMPGQDGRIGTWIATLGTLNRLLQCVNSPDVKFDFIPHAELFGAHWALKLAILVVNYLEGLTQLHLLPDWQVDDRWPWHRCQVYIRSPARGSPVLIDVIRVPLLTQLIWWIVITQRGPWPFVRMHMLTNFIFFPHCVVHSINASSTLSTLLKITRQVHKKLSTLLKIIRQVHKKVSTLLKIIQVHKKCPHC